MSETTSKKLVVAEDLRKEIVELVLHIQKLESVMMGMHERLDQMNDRIETLEDDRSSSNQHSSIILS